MSPANGPPRPTEPAEPPEVLDAYDGVRALVLGGSGFIGSRVVWALARRGARTVTTVRRAADGHATSTLPVPARPAEEVKIDLRRLEQLPDLLRRARPSIVFNLAGYGVDPSERDEEQAYLINAELPATLAESMAELRRESWTGQVLIHAGSAAEYGAVGGNLSENSPAHPLGLYGASKLAGTEQLRECATRTGLPALTARLFVVYGPGEHPGRLLPSLIDAARTGRPLDLTEGTQRRDFAYVEDVAEGLLRLGLSGAEPGEVVNLATGRLTSVRRFAETAASILGIPPAKLQFGALPTRPDEMVHDPVSIARLRELVSWAPRTTIAEGIGSTLKGMAGLAPRQHI